MTSSTGALGEMELLCYVQLEVRYNECILYSCTVGYERNIQYSAVCYNENVCRSEDWPD